MRLWIGIFCLSALIIGLVLPNRAIAQSTAQLESRLGRLESDIYQVRSELSRLEAQIYNVGRSGSSTVAPPPSASRYEPNFPRSTPPQSAMFDRLATLAIELKERITSLETRVTRLEKSGVPRS